jgi:DNA primase
MTNKLIPQEFIDTILARTDIVDLISNYIALKRQGSRFVACCPFHKEKSPSFNVVPDKQFYHCFGCGVSGNAISFVMEHLNQTFPVAIETLALPLGLELKVENSTLQKLSSHKELYNVLTIVARFYQNELKKSVNHAVLYLKNRGISGLIAKTYGIGYAPKDWHSLENKFTKNELLLSGMIIEKNGKFYDRYRDRIMFPIHNPFGKIIGFGGRTIDPNDSPKYLNSPETNIFQKSHELYGLYQVIQHHKNPEAIIIVEGYMDVIALAEHGITNAVATLGTSTNPQHIQKLLKYTKKIVFCFDGDLAGQNAAWRALEHTLAYLNLGLSIEFIFLPENDDPDSLIRREGREYFLKCLKNARPLHKFFLQKLEEDLDAQDLSGKSQIIVKAKPYITKMGQGPYQELICNEIAAITRVDADRINKLIFKDEEMNVLQAQAPKTIQRSPENLALAILLQNPKIYLELPKPIANHDLLSIDDNVLIIISALRTNPNISTAQLVELFRDSKIFTHINALATWEMHLSREVILQELQDTLNFLIKKTDEHEIDKLIHKARRETLSEQDQVALQDLLMRRHRPTDKIN